MPFFAEKPTFWAKSQAFYTFPPPWDTVSLFAPVPPWYSISACSRTAAVQYLCLLPSRRGIVSLLAHALPRDTIFLLAPLPLDTVFLLAPLPLDTVFLPAHTLPLGTVFLLAHALPRGTIFPLIPDKGNFYCQSESPCLFSLSRKNFYKKSGFAASRAA